MSTTLEPANALHLLENSLRLMLHDVLSGADQLGPTWRDQICTPRQIKKWDGMAATWASANPGLAPYPDSTGLAWVEFPELLDMVDSQWSRVGGALGGDADLVALLRLLKGTRRDVAHSRDVVAHKAELLSGTARLVAGMVAKRMSTRDDAGDFYPTITAVTDNLGNAATINGTGEIAGGLQGQHTLHPGDEVMIRMTGVDPQDRELTWEMPSTDSAGHGATIVKTSPSGEPVELTWVVGEHDVREECYQNVYMRSSGRYHRSGSFDQRVWLVYRIREA
jgi:hypothetical protein